jgi:two-component system response regulator FlrC
LRHPLNSVSTDRARVLLVDDLPELRRTVCRVLRASGYDVVEADGGLMALEAANAHSVDVVLTDVMMPDLDGIELLRRLRERHPSLPVVLMSAAPSEDTASQARAWGAFDYLTKPVRTQPLLAAIARALASRRTPLAAAETYLMPAPVGAES